MHFILTLTMSMVLSTSVLACPESFESFGTENIALKDFTSISKERHLSKRLWDEVLDEIETLYNYHLTPAGVELKIDRYWNDPRTNGTVRREGKLWRVLIYGGYTTSPHVTADVIARVACHEIGHHLGGTVFYPGAYSWAAGEGQSDYFATLKCLRKYFEDKDNARALAKVKIPAIVREKCEQVWSDVRDQLICMRSSMAAKAWTLVMFNNDSFKFETPDSDVVKVTNVYHPDPQCRLDTHFQGALCTADHRVDIDLNDPSVGTCTSGKYEVGLRPKCWYRPGSL